MTERRSSISAIRRGRGRAAAGPGARRGAGGAGLSGRAGPPWPGRGAGGPGGVSRRRRACRGAGRGRGLAALEGWVYMALSCLCGLAGVRLWLVPRSREAGAVTTRAGPQETHRINVGLWSTRWCRQRVRERAAPGRRGGEGRVPEQAATDFGGLLRLLRAEAGLTQEELAEAARLSPRSVSDLERGINRTARKDTARLLAGALGLIVFSRRPSGGRLRRRRRAPRRRRALPRPVACMVSRPR